MRIKGKVVNIYDAVLNQERILGNFVEAEIEVEKPTEEEKKIALSNDASRKILVSVPIGLWECVGEIVAILPKEESKKEIYEMEKVRVDWGQFEDRDKGGLRLSDFSLIKKLALLVRELYEERKSK
jgi:hypothetical protein